MLKILQYYVTNNIKNGDMKEEKRNERKKRFKLSYLILYIMYSLLLCYFI